MRKAWSSLSMADKTKYIQDMVRQGISNLDEISALYNAFAEGGTDNETPPTIPPSWSVGQTSYEGTRLEPWKALNNIYYEAYPDTSFTRENTGVGSIEAYPKGSYIGENYPKTKWLSFSPNPAVNAIRYDPASNDAQDIRMDALHFMPDDATYDVLRQQLINEAKYYEDIKEAAGRQYNDWTANTEDPKNLMPYEQFVKNEVDGLLRNMFIQGTDQYILGKHYYRNPEDYKEWYPGLIPYVDRIHDYLRTGKRPADILPEVVVSKNNSYAEGGPLTNIHEVEDILDELKPGDIEELKQSVKEHEHNNNNTEDWKNAMYQAYPQGTNVLGYTKDGTPIETVVTGYAPVRLYTYYPFGNEYPLSGHSRLMVPISSDVAQAYTGLLDKNDYNEYLQKMDYNTEYPPYAGYVEVDKKMNDKGYNLYLNNCADATLRYLEHMYGKYDDPMFFTTPGDVRDFAINVLGGKPTTEGGIETVLIPRNAYNANTVSELALLLHLLGQTDPRYSGASYNKTFPLDPNHLAYEKTKQRVKRLKEKMGRRTLMNRIFRSLKPESSPVGYLQKHAYGGPLGNVYDGTGDEPNYLLVTEETPDATAVRGYQDMLKSAEANNEAWKQWARANYMVNPSTGNIMNYLLPEVNITAPYKGNNQEYLAILNDPTATAEEKLAATDSLRTRGDALQHSVNSAMDTVGREMLDKGLMAASFVNPAIGAGYMAGMTGIGAYDMYQNGINENNALQVGLGLLPVLSRGKTIINGIKNVPDKLGLFVKKPNTYTRGIGMGEEGLRDLVETRIVRGNPRGTEMTAKDFVKRFEKNRDGFRDIMKSTGIKGIESKFQSRTLSEKEFNAIKEASKGRTIKRMVFEDGTFKTVELPADPLGLYEDYNAYKNSIAQTVEKVNKMPNRISAGEVAVNNTLTPNEEGMLFGRPIEERFGPNSDYVADGTPLSYWYTDGRNPTTKGYSYAGSKYGVRVNNPEDYVPFRHELHLHDSFFKSPQLTDPNVEVFKRGPFGITIRMDKDKLLKKYGTSQHPSREALSEDVIRLIEQDTGSVPLSLKSKTNKTMLSKSSDGTSTIHGTYNPNEVGAAAGTVTIEPFTINKAIAGPLQLEELQYAQDYINNIVIPRARLLGVYNEAMAEHKAVDQLLLGKGVLVDDLGEYVSGMTDGSLITLNREGRSEGTFLHEMRHVMDSERSLNSSSRNPIIRLLTTELPYSSDLLHGRKPTISLTPALEKIIKDTYTTGKLFSSSNRITEKLSVNSEIGSILYNKYVNTFKKIPSVQELDKWIDSLDAVEMLKLIHNNMYSEYWENYMLHNIGKKIGKSKDGIYHISASANRPIIEEWANKIKTALKIPSVALPIGIAGATYGTLQDNQKSLGGNLFPDGGNILQGEYSDDRQTLNWLAPTLDEVVITAQNPKYKKIYDKFQKKYDEIGHTGSGYAGNTYMSNGNYITLKTKGNMNLASIPTNVLDSIAINTGRSKTNIRTNLGLVGKESTFAPSIGYSEPFSIPMKANNYLTLGIAKNREEAIQKAISDGKTDEYNDQRLISNWAYDNTPYDDAFDQLLISGTLDALRDGVLNEKQRQTLLQLERDMQNGTLKNSVKKYHENPMADGFARYADNPKGYNSGQGNYVQMVNNIANEVWNEPQIQRWWREEGRDWYNKGKNGYSFGGNLFNNGGGIPPLGPYAGLMLPLKFLTNRLGITNNSGYVSTLPKDNKNWNYIKRQLKKSGRFTDTLIEGIGLSLNRESGFDPEAVGDNGKAVGIALWRGIRQPKDRSFDGQIQHLISTLGEYDGDTHWIGKDNYDGFMNARTPEEAHYYIAKGWERPRADITENLRMQMDNSLKGIKHAIGGNLYAPGGGLYNFCKGQPDNGSALQGQQLLLQLADMYMNKKKQEAEAEAALQEAQPEVLPTSASNTNVNLEPVEWPLYNFPLTLTFAMPDINFEGSSETPESSESGKDRYAKFMDYLNLVEGFQNKAYRLAGEEFPTIGFGFYHYYPGTKREVKMGDTITREEAFKYLPIAIQEKVDKIKKKLGSEWDMLTPNQQDALLDIAYNAGPDAAHFNYTSRLRQAIRRKDWAAAAEELGTRSKTYDLSNRNRARRKIWNSGDYSGYDDARTTKLLKAKEGALRILNLKKLAYTPINMNDYAEKMKLIRRPQIDYVKQILGI